MGSSYEKVLKKTRHQLLTYPKHSNKDILKHILKSIVSKQASLKHKKYFWPNGLLAIALEYSYKLNRSKNDFKTLKKYYDSWLKNKLPIKNTDYTINGYTLIYLYEETSNEKYLNALYNINDYLIETHKTKEGSIPYRTKKPDRVLVDTLGMTCPFLCRYGFEFGNQKSVNLAIRQLENFIKYGIDEHSGLPYHGYNVNEGVKLGIIGWGRAVGWLLIGFVDSLEYIPKNHAKYNYLKLIYQDIVDKVIVYQDETGHFKWQLPANEGYNDTSATSMIIYAISKGIRLNLLPDTMNSYVELSINALSMNIVDGRVMKSSAECRGISMYPQNYNNFPWAQGPTTMVFTLN